MNANLVKTQIFHEIKYDLKGTFMFFILKTYFTKSFEEC